MIERMGPYGLFDLPKLGFNVIEIPTFKVSNSRPSFIRLYAEQPHLFPDF